MKSLIVVSAAGAVLVAASCSACSDQKSDRDSGAAASPGATLTVEGQKQNIAGAITCTTKDGNTTLGVGDAANGIGAVVSDATPPIVHAVGLGAVDNITLGFSDAAPNAGSNAGAEKKGNTYAIRGTATGLDASNAASPQTVTKQFELTVTCP